MTSSSVRIIFLILAGALYVAGDTPPMNPDHDRCAKVDECADLDGMCCEGLRGGCCENGVCVLSSTVCKVNGERCGRVRCSTSEACLRSQPAICCPNSIVPILPTCKPKCGNRACYRNEECITKPSGQTCVKKAQP